MLRGIPNQSRASSLGQFSMIVAAVVAMAAPLVESPAADEPAASDGRWRTAADGATTNSASSTFGRSTPASSASNPSAADATIPRRLEEARTPIASVTNGTGRLPNEHGQVWREYDISEYVLRVSSTKRPEQAIVDWVLRETGYEAWHSEPLAILRATPRSLTVYHTPQMQAVVADLVDRFVTSEAASHAFGVRLVTVGHPNWRAKAQSLLHPVAVQSQGVQAWLLAKEDAALLVAELRRRTDYREHSSPHLIVNNGQSTTITSTRPQSYIQNVTVRPELWPSFEPVMAQYEEGFTLEMSPLLSLDGTTIDAVIRCDIDQLEKLVPVVLEVPSPAAQRQRTQVQVPQVSQCRLHERFRWPKDQVLLVGMGMVATPVAGDPGGLKLPLPFPSSPPRADLLVFVESKGTVAESGETPQTAAGRPQLYRGRY